VYLSRRQAKKALPYFHESYRIDYQIGDSRALLLVLSNLARSYSQLGKLDSASYYVVLGLDVAKKNSNLTEISDIYEVAAITYGKLNDTKKQVYYQSLKNQHDSLILNKAQRSEIGIAAAEYENDRKSQKLKLMEKENEINQLKIHEQELELESRNLLLVAVALVFYLLSLNKKNKLFEMGSRAKTSVLQQMNHEIRTPLNGIVGMSQLALESKTFTELKDYLSYIKQSSDDLMFVLNNLITFLQIDRKEAYPQAAPFNLLMSLEELFKIYSTKCKNKGLLFNQMVYPGVPQTINADRQKILIMVQNLLSNAVNYCQKGVVKVEVKQSASRVKDGKRLSTIQFSVIDEGEGLSEKEIKNLFKKVNKENAIEAGFGIGLSNVKYLSDLMKGHIEVISEKGVGSSFILEIEVEDLDGNEMEFKSGKSMNRIFEPKKYHVLVVEDNLINQTLFAKLLEKEGYNVTVVGNGLSALASMRTHSFDIAIMDVRLPEMDGIETTQHIRNRSEFSNMRNIPIIGITAQDDSQEKKKCLEVGMNDYHTKPINRELFLNAIETQLLAKN
jgi:signal transduction histidine kinase/CheY-like chemotaxis protein